MRIVFQIHKEQHFIPATAESSFIIIVCAADFLQHL